MARTARAALGIEGWFRRHRQGDLREWILVGVRVARRRGAVLFERPGEDALLTKVGDLQMIRPLREGEVSLDDGGKSMIQVGLVAGDARRKLRDEIGVVESFLLFGAQVGLDRKSVV